MTIDTFQIAIYLSYGLAVWFFIAFVLSLWFKSKTVLCTFTLLLIWSVYSYVLHEEMMSHLSTVQMYEVIAWFDLITALIITMWLKGSIGESFVRTLPSYLRYDELAWAYAIIILLTSICHFVMLRDVVLLLDVSNSYTPTIIYTWYDELIILGQVAQIMVASYGMVKSIRTPNVLHQTTIDYSIGVDCYIASLQRQKEREART